MMDSLDPTRTFATFVVGGANQLAAAAARTLAESARPPFNPLYLWGESGQGKTHLLHATGAHRRSVDPEGKVLCLGAPELTHLLEARTEAGIEPLREVGLLMLDDVDRVPSRTRLGTLLQERLEAGRATVVSARKGPVEWLGGEEVLARALGGGLVVEIGAPDLALREEIVRRRAEFAGVSFARAVVEEVVRMPLATVQELLGTINRLIAFQEVSSTPLDAMQTRVLVTGMAPADLMVGAKSFVTPVEAPLRHPDDGREESDEFGAFLSEIVAGVSSQVDRWRSLVAGEILRWEAEGIRCARLQALLDQEVAAQPDAVLRQFARDVDAIQAIRVALEALSPGLGEAEVLRDPDRIREATQLLEEARTQGLAAMGPNRDLTLEGLIEVPSNRTVFATVRQAADGGTPGHNPLLLLGASGTAKTHLLHSYGNLLVAGGRSAVVLSGALALAVEAEEAGQASRAAEWSQRYRWAGALLIDDLHLLAGHPVAQDALLGVVEALLEAGRPVAATSAIPPAELVGISPQLLARVAGGLCLDLPAPDRDVRRGLVTNLLAATEGGGDAGLIEYIASGSGDSVRAIHAAVRRVLVAAARTGNPPSLTLARQVMSSGHSTSRTGPERALAGGRGLGGTRVREKVVERWPEPRQRLIEEMG